MHHNLRQIVRRLRRQPGYTFLNVSGLALGLVTCAILLIFVREEVRYDHYHEHASRLGLLAAQTDVQGAATPHTRLPAPLAGELQSRIPGIRHTVRVRGAGAVGYRLDERSGVLDAGTYYVTPEVFEVFSFPMLAGDPATALAAPDGLVINEPLAQVLFGEAPADVLGREIELNGRPMLVTGVMEEVPAASHWRPRLLLPASRGDELVGAGMNPYFVFANRIYVLADPNHDLQAIAEAANALPAATWEYTSLEDATFGLQPIERIHLHGDNPWGIVDTSLSLQELSRLARLRVLGAVALLILLLAAINYVNLSTAYGLRHAREVGVRKTLGASRGRVAAQFLTESTLLAAVASGVALLLVPLALPFFGEMVQAELRFDPLAEWPVALAFLATGAAVGVVAGLYPALALSRPSPAGVFRSSHPAGASGQRTRRMLVVVQFTVSVTLVICTLLMGRQLAFMHTERLGLEPEQVLTVELRWGDAAASRAVIEDRLSASPAVLQTAVTSVVPGSGRRMFSSFRQSDDQPTRYVYDVVASPSFREVLGIELIAGSDLPSGAVSEDRPPVLISETAARAMGWTPEEAVGLHFPFPDASPVVGVIADFRYGSMREEIRPVQVRPMGPDGWPDALLVRFRPAEAADALAAVRAAWEEVAPGTPLRTRFLDEAFAHLYASERRLTTLFRAFAALAIGIACLGLFGLAAYTAQSRRREIGIRKALGASVGQLLQLLTGDLLRLVALAMLAAAPLAYVVMSRWLDGFVYRVPIGVDLFLAAGGIALLTASGAIAYHAIRAAILNPVDAIRHD
jgi:putative ABC transport system permease protein